MKKNMILFSFFIVSIMLLSACGDSKTICTGQSKAKLLSNAKITIQAKKDDIKNIDIKNDINLNDIYPSADEVDGLKMTLENKKYREKYQKNLKIKFENEVINYIQSNINVKEDDIKKNMVSKINYEKSKEKFLLKISVDVSKLDTDDKLSEEKLVKSLEKIEFKCK